MSTSWDDEAQEALRHGVLRALANGAAGKAWQEVGRDVLSGGATLRDVGLSAAYADLFAEAAQRLQEHRDGLDEAEAAQEERDAARAFEALREHLRQADGGDG